MSEDDVRDYAGVSSSTLFGVRRSLADITWDACARRVGAGEAIGAAVLARVPLERELADVIADGLRVREGQPLDADVIRERAANLAMALVGEFDIAKREIR